MAGGVGKAERHKRIKTRRRDGLCAALAVAFHNQILPVPFGQRTRIFESAEHAEIHAKIIDRFALHAATMAVVGQFAFVELRIEFQRLAVDDAVGVDVQADGTGHATNDGTADTRAMIDHNDGK